MRTLAGSRDRRAEGAGAVFVVDLGDGTKAVARRLNVPLCEFFDLHLDATADVDMTALTSSKILFRLWVTSSAFDGRWQHVGVVPLSEEEQTRREVFFKQGALNGRLELYWSAHGEVHTEPTSFDACVGLERAAVWDAVHVEDRLRDHFAGVANKWEMSLRPKPPP